MPKVILYAFLGRRSNVELQMPFIRRILDESPDVVFHAWNLARLPEDAEFIRTLSGDRVVVKNDFYNQPDGWNNVYRHYANPEYRDCVFVKFDDDIVFIETDRFKDLVEAVKPGAIVSAQVINNGSCTPMEPELWTGFQKLGIHLLDVHLSNKYAEMSHQFFFKNWKNLISRDVKHFEPKSWLSINFIAMDWDTNRVIAERVGGPSPAKIMDRTWPVGQILGDEGAANEFPLVICRGFTVAHLGFGPQGIDDIQADRWRREYRKIAEEYLS